MIELTENDKKIIKNISYSQKEHLSFGDFFIKLVGPERGLKEMIGTEIANQMGLVCPRINIAIIDGWEYLLSEDLNDYGKFVNAEDLEIGTVEEYCSLEEASNSLENKYGLGTEINNLIKIYIFDILFKHFDRNKRNWGVIFLPDGSKKLAMLDNEYILVDNDKREKLKLYFKPALPISLEEDFTSFLNDGAEEDILLFEYYFNLYNPGFIGNLIDRLIKRSGLDSTVKEEILGEYQKHYLKLQEIFRREYKEKHSRI